MLVAWRIFIEANHWANACGRAQNKQLAFLVIRYLIYLSNNSVSLRNYFFVLPLLFATMLSPTLFTEKMSAP